MNADGTVDFLDCDGRFGEIRVDYQTEEEWEQVPGAATDEWFAAADDVTSDQWAVDVAHYGEVPRGWQESAPALPPPADWYAVDVGLGTALRSDLREGEWLWHLREHWGWIPPHPCAGWIVGPDGEPRKSS